MTKKEKPEFSEIPEIEQLYLEIKHKDQGFSYRLKKRSEPYRNSPMRLLRFLRNQLISYRGRLLEKSTLLSRVQRIQESVAKSQALHAQRYVPRMHGTQALESEPSYHQEIKERKTREAAKRKRLP